jgi:uncharacterized protein (DUF1778 family)
MAISAHEQPRDRRFQLRATASEEELIRVAADRQSVNVTEFIMRSACERAEQALAEQTRFVLGEKQWKAFLAALDGRGAARIRHRQIQPRARCERIRLRQRSPERVLRKFAWTNQQADSARTYVAVDGNSVPATTRSPRAPYTSAKGRSGSRRAWAIIRSAWCYSRDWPLIERCAREATDLRKARR